MSKKEYNRKTKPDKPVLAICYDFDKTLTPTDMQAQGYIQTVGYDDPDGFWNESNSLADDHEMDRNLAYMYKMKEEAEGKLLFTKQQLKEYGEKVELFQGVDTWFDRIRKYGSEQGVIVEHYIISSGLKEMIEATSVAQSGAFEQVFASSFLYNEKDVAIWPAQVVNYTNKTQFLFRIVKGTLDVNDPGVNDAFEPEEIRVPFRNMVYIGDSDTDIPCMKLVNSYGGYSIGVYDADKKDKTNVYEMMRNERIKYFAPTDYSEDSELDELIKLIIDRTAKNEQLEKKHYTQKQEVAMEDKKHDKTAQEKSRAIVALENSHSFTDTHIAIKKLKEYKKWDKSERDRLFSIALKNSQVRYIIEDEDVFTFFSRLLKQTKSFDEPAKRVKEIIDKCKQSEG